MPPSLPPSLAVRAWELPKGSEEGQDWYDVCTEEGRRSLIHANFVDIQNWKCRWRGVSQKSQKFCRRYICTCPLGREGASRSSSGAWPPIVRRRTYRGRARRRSLILRTDTLALLQKLQIVSLFIGWKSGHDESRQIIWDEITTRVTFSMQGNLKLFHVVYL